jgi:hypothetical protein
VQPKTLDPESAGFYGKLPSRGDFIRRGLTRDFLEPWHRAMAVALADQTYPLDALWQAASGVELRFVLGPGCAGAFAWCGGLTATVGMTVMVLRPLTWRAEAELSLGEPTLTARLVNPSAALVDPEEALDGLEHRLRSTAQLVALAKAAGLSEQLETVQTPTERAWGLVAERSEADQIDLLTALAAEFLHDCGVGGAALVVIAVIPARALGRHAARL